MNGGDRERADTRAALGHVLWLLGGSRAGKSTVRKMLVDEFGFAFYDGDAVAFRHMGSCTREGSPTMWTAQQYVEKNQYWEWILGKKGKDLADFFRDGGQEDFEYVVSDLFAMPTDARIVADIAAPYMEGIARVADTTNMVVMLSTDAFQRKMLIETNLIARGEEQLKNVSDGQRLFSKYVRSEADRLNLSVIETGGRLNIDEMYVAVCRHFGLRRTT